MNKQEAYIYLPEMAWYDASVQDPENDETRCEAHRAARVLASVGPSSSAWNTVARTNRVCGHRLAVDLRLASAHTTTDLWCRIRKLDETAP